MVKVYIASPYSIGNKEENVIKAMIACNELINQGFAPYSPLLWHFQNLHFPQPEKKWLEIDIEYLKTCHKVLRLSGESKGADLECEIAKAEGIPVYYDIKSLSV